MRSKFIVLEGIDGSGTTTQATRLAQAIRGKGQEVLLTKEPSPGPIGLLLRQQLSATPPMDKHALALLFAADRVDHIQREVLPALEAGKVVISDRYILSSLAYQSTECGRDWIQQINGLCTRQDYHWAPTSHYLPADVTFFLRIDPEEAVRRVSARGGQVERYDALETQRRVAEQYESDHHRLGGLLVQLDATKSIEDLTEEMLRHLGV